MSLPIGQISLSQVNVELGFSSTATISLNQADVRGLAGVPSGAISMQNLQGKSNIFAFSITSNQTNANLRTLAINAGWPESGKVVATINGGVQISSSSSGTPALTVNGSFPSGVELINNGLIWGRGGAGGAGGFTTGFDNANGVPGGGGGTALSVSVALTLNNAGTISGGGGGGGGGARGANDSVDTGGGGGGGGSGFGAAGAAGIGNGFTSPNGSPGVAGLQTTGGNGGAGRSFGSAAGGAGGAGGSNAAAGVAGGSGNLGSPRAPGGSGGNAITGNVNITYIATGTRIGGVS